MCNEVLPFYSVIWYYRTYISVTTAIIKIQSICITHEAPLYTCVGGVHTPVQPQTTALLPSLGQSCLWRSHTGTAVLCALLW